MSFLWAQAHMQTFDTQVQPGLQHFQWGPLTSLWTPELRLEYRKEDYSQCPGQLPLPSVLEWF